MADKTDVVLQLFAEERAQVRQSETQRATLTNIVIIVVGESLAFISDRKLRTDALPLRVPLGSSVTDRRAVVLLSVRLAREVDDGHRQDDPALAQSTPARAVAFLAAVRTSEPKADAVRALVLHLMRQLSTPRFDLPQGPDRRPSQPLPVR